MNKTGVALTSLVAGALIGAAIAALLTPKSGPELRKKIKDLVGDEVDKVRDKVDELRDKLEQTLEKTQGEEVEKQ